jgi:hypothetical protein
MTASLPVAVIGAGPVGLAAAAHLHARGVPFLVLEAGPAAGDAVRRWGHVRLFSPWRELVDREAAALLRRHGWEMPDPDEIPRGAELAARMIGPLAALPEIAPHLRLGARVVAVGRAGMDRVPSAGRADRPFAVDVVHADGREERIAARAVIDASGTWGRPNPAGAGGVPAPGERRAAAAGLVRYAIPDVRGADRGAFAGRTTVVLGSGHSAMNLVLDLAALAAEAPGTRTVWAMRRDDPDRAYGGGSADALAGRGALGLAARRAVEGGSAVLATGFRLASVDTPADGGLVLAAEDGRTLRADVLVAATGFRPDLSFLEEVRLDLDPALGCPRALGPLIDPNVHSCGTVRPHGARELAQPEPGLYLAGMKSYGRAPTFLMLTGYEQVRSIAADIAGDLEAAARVELVLPETGVCSAGPRRRLAAAEPAAPAPAPASAGSACCRPAAAAPAPAPACC